MATTNAAYRRLLVFPQVGRIDRDAAVAAIRRENADGCSWAEVTIDDVDGRWISDDVALMTYHVTARWNYDPTGVGHAHTRSGIRLIPIEGAVDGKPAACGARGRRRYGLCELSPSTRMWAGLGSWPRPWSRDRGWFNY